MKLVYMLITLTVSIVGGAISGTIVKGLGAILDPFEADNLFNDMQHWEVPGLENPYYFDHRGEIQRDPKKDERDVNKDVNLKLEGLIEKVNILEKKSQEGGAFNMNVATFFKQFAKKDV